MAMVVYVVWFWHWVGEGSLVEVKVNRLFCAFSINQGMFAVVGINDSLKKRHEIPVCSTECDLVVYCFVLL